MKITRNINGIDISIKLTYEEKFEAHKEFLLDFFNSCVIDILQRNEDIKELYKEQIINEIAERAYDIYSEGNGETEYESCEKSCNEYFKEIKTKNQIDCQ